MVGKSHDFNFFICMGEDIMHVPKEFTIGGVYMPPLLIAGILGVLAAWLTAMLLNRYRLSHFFYNPPLIFIALAIIYTVLFGFLIIPF